MTNRGFIARCRQSRGDEIVRVYSPEFSLRDVTWRRCCSHRAENCRRLREKIISRCSVCTRNSSARYGIATSVSLAGEAIRRKRGLVSNCPTSLYSGVPLIRRAGCTARRRRRRRRRRGRKRGRGRGRRRGRRCARKASDYPAKRAPPPSSPRCGIKLVIRTRGVN